TLQGSYYGDIRSALKSGRGLGSGYYSGLATWSGMGYSNVGGTWAQAGKYMSGQAVPLPGGGGSSGGGGGGRGKGGGGLGQWVSELWQSLQVGAAADPGAPAALGAVQGASDVAQAVVGLSAPLVKIGQAVDFLMQPNHWIRIFAGIGGGILLGV